MQLRAAVILLLMLTAASGMAVPPGLAATSNGDAGSGPAAGAPPTEAPGAADPLDLRTSNHTTQPPGNTTTDNTTTDAPGTGDGLTDGNGTGVPVPRNAATAAVVWVGVVAAVAVGAFLYGRQRQP